MKLWRFHNVCVENIYGYFYVVERCWKCENELELLYVHLLLNVWIIYKGIYVYLVSDDLPYLVYQMEQKPFWMRL